MKPKLLDTILFLLITPLTITTIILLFITFLSTTNFSNKHTVPKDDSMLIMSPEPLIEQQRANLIERDYNAYTMRKIERNNMEIFKITEEINEVETLKLENTQINNLNEQNIQLNDSLDNQDVESNNWQGFKTYVNINFKTMGLSFSELYAQNDEE